MRFYMALLLVVTFTVPVVACDKRVPVAPVAPVVPAPVAPLPQFSVQALQAFAAPSVTTTTTTTQTTQQQAVQAFAAPVVPLAVVPYAVPVAYQAVAVQRMGPLRRLFSGPRYQAVPLAGYAY